MTQALAVLREDRSMTVAGSMELAMMSDDEFGLRLATLKKAKTRIREVMRSVMNEGTDFGSLPGTDKNKKVLFKSGAEALCSMYRLVPSYEVIRHLGDGLVGPHLSYQVTCYLHPGDVDAPAVGSGVGECNSWEDKYRYRSAVHACPECQASAIKRGAERFGGGWYCDRKAGGCGEKFRNDAFAAGKMENPDPFSLGNTILKMAKKRAYVDATLEALDASDLFTQDVADDEVEPPAVKRTMAPSAPPQDDVIDGEVTGSDDDWRSLNYKVAHSDTKTHFRALSAFQKARPAGAKAPAEADTMTLGAVIDALTGGGEPPEETAS